MSKVAAYLKASSGFDEAVGVPIAFDVAYASDFTPMRIYETKEFAGSIPDGPSTRS